VANVPNARKPIQGPKPYEIELSLARILENSEKLGTIGRRLSGRLIDVLLCDLPARSLTKCPELGQLIVYILTAIGQRDAGNTFVGCVATSVGSCW
jgi:hypothetical protein